MTAGLAALVVVAFQVFDVVGWAARGVWTWRMLHQWVASERAARSVLPSSFWTWSLLGSCLDLVYLFHRRDPVFVSGTLISACVYARNLWMMRRPAPPRSPVGGLSRVLWPVLAGLVLFAAITVEAIGPEHGLVRYDRAVPWLVAGFAGQVAWTGRFVVQWYESEKKGVSHLPASFFAWGCVGAVLLLAYAISQQDWVMSAAFGPNVIPYVRNLVLLRRERLAARAPDGPA